MKKFTYLYICLVLLSFLGCNCRRMTAQLDSISQMADEHPDSALALLRKYDNEKTRWSKGDRMYYELVRLKAENKSFISFTTDTIVNEVVDYFKNHGSSNERMLAYYLQGRVYADMGEAPQALQAYYDAIESADTTSSDCDYQVLIPVYGQMSRIFHKQNLPHDEIWALQHYINLIRKHNSYREYLMEKNQMIRPYYLLGEKDTVLHIINDTYKALKRIGANHEAADALVVSIHIYIERGWLEKARQIIDIFEKESGLFDMVGNIAKGREAYYATKGLYELKINKLDSAEYYYRKVIKYGHQLDGYRGLLYVYRTRNVPDSISHYSLLFESALDSLHNKTEIDVIHRMSSLYNYSRSQKIAEQEAAKARTAKQWTSVVVVCLIVLMILFGAYIKLHRRRQELMALRIRQLEEFKLAYEKTEESERNQTEQSIRQTPIYQRLAMMKETEHPTDEDWQSLTDTINEAYPQFTSRLFSLCRMSSHEHHVCLLLKAGFDPVCIATLTLRSKAAISVVRSRLYEKAFGKKGSSKDWDEVILTL